MTRRLWIADEVLAGRALLKGEHAAHLSRVLRAQPGQEFDIAIGPSVQRGRIVSVTEDCVEFALGEEVPVTIAPTVTLALAIFKFDRLEWAIEKCTEIGVARIIPVIARRTDSHLAIAAVKRRERWERLALQAAQQSRQSKPPEIAAPVKMQALAEFPAGSRIVLAESEQDTSLREALTTHPAEVTLAIGPEGGWTEEELIWFSKNGWQSATLGPTILRAETAAIVATAIAFDALR